MAFVVGINVAVALCLAGYVPGIAMQPLLRFYALHWFAVAAIFLSGTALLLAYPAKALTNPVFYLKLLALTVGLVLAARFQRLIRQGGLAEYKPPRLKSLAWLALSMWVVAITAGRFLAYTNSVLLASRAF